MKSFFCVCVKLVKNNFFLNISNNNGRTLYIKNAGTLGFVNINKRNPEILQKLIFSSIDFLANATTKQGFLYIKLEGFTSWNLRLLYTQYKKLVNQINFKILALKVIHKIPHSGCRKKSIKI